MGHTAGIFEVFRFVFFGDPG
eukprot:COSAG01_NODE_43463_length_429_cov_2.015152_1_plen_20_part_10